MPKSIDRNCIDPIHVDRRRLEELSAIAHAPPVPYSFSTIQPFEDSYSIARLTSKEESLRPKLPSLSQLSHSIESLNSSNKAVIKGSGPLFTKEGVIQVTTTPIDGDVHLAIQKLLCHLVDEHGRHALTQEDLFAQVKDWMKAAETEMQEANQGHRNHASANRVVSIVQKAVESFGLILAGIISALTMGTVVLGAAAVVVGGIMLFEMAFNDALKKEAAKWMQRATNETEEAWLYRIQMFSSAIAMTLGLGVVGVQAIQIAKGISDVALASIKAGIDYRSDGYLKEKISLDHAIEMAKNLVERITQGVSANVEKLQQLMKITASVDKTRKEMARSIFQA